MKHLAPQILLAACLGLFAPASAETIVASCKGLTGQSSYINDTPSAWAPETSNSSRFHLIQSLGAYHVVFDGLLGRSSTKTLGGKVVSVSKDGSSVTLYVTYKTGNVHETFTFDLAKKKMYFTQQRLAGGIPKVGAFVSRCA